MWNRLIAVVEEQAQALLRTAFGAVAREAGDLSAGVYDRGGRMLAQAVTGTPGHVNTMATAVGHFLDRFPLDDHAAGRRLRHQRPLARHRPSVRLRRGHAGVRGRPSRSRSSPRPATRSTSAASASPPMRARCSRKASASRTCRLRRGGRLNDDLLAIILANSRNPVEARGDLLSLVSCNDVGAARLLDMMARVRARRRSTSLREHILDAVAQGDPRGDRAPAATASWRARDAARRLRGADRAAGRA